MRLILDLDNQLLVSAAGTTAPASSVAAKRSSVGVVGIQVVQGGALVTDEVADLELKFVAKRTEEYDQTPLVTTQAFAWQADRGQYEAPVNWITTTLNALFGVQGAALTITGGVASTNVITTSTAHGFEVGDRIYFPELTGGAGITAAETTHYYVKTAPTSTTFTISATSGGAELDFTTDISAGYVRQDEENEASITLAIEVGYRFDPGDAWAPSENEVALTLRNNYIRDDDGTPEDPESVAALAWLDDHAVRHDDAQSLTRAAQSRALNNIQIICGALTGGGTSPLALDALVTVDTISTGFVAFCVTSNILSAWQLQAGTTAEDSANGIVRPDDYHGTTNARIWIRVL